MSCFDSFASRSSYLDYWIAETTQLPADQTPPPAPPNQLPAIPTSSTEASTSSAQQCFANLPAIATTCQHRGVSTQDDPHVFFPRAYQHHAMRRWMKARYRAHGYDLRRNSRCPPSPCNNDPAGPTAASSLDLVAHRYLRQSATGREALCRFCSGLNWVPTNVYFRHLFFAHGVMTSVSSNSDADIVNHVKVTSLNNVQHVTAISAAISLTPMSLAPALRVTLVPPPVKYYCATLSSGFRRIHVLCGGCGQYVRLGWCEHDEILREEQVRAKGICTMRNLTTKFYDVFDPSVAYRQQRDRRLIEGVYENYHVHYVQCQATLFRDHCLYVELTT